MPKKKTSLEETIAGKIWLVPESDLENFEPPRMGRPPKVQDKIK